MWDYPNEWYSSLMIVEYNVCMVGIFQVYCSRWKYCTLVLCISFECLRGLRLWIRFDGKRLTGILRSNVVRVIWGRGFYGSPRLRRVFRCACCLIVIYRKVEYQFSFFWIFSVIINVLKTN